MYLYIHVSNKAWILERTEQHTQNKHAVIFKEKELCQTAYTVTVNTHKVQTAYTVTVNTHKVQTAYTVTVNTHKVQTAYTVTVNTHKGSNAGIEGIRLQTEVAL